MVQLKKVIVGGGGTPLIYFTNLHFANEVAKKEGINVCELIYDDDGIGVLIGYGLYDQGLIKEEELYLKYSKEDLIWGMFMEPTTAT